MAKSNNVCYYGRHIGCLNADDPMCRLCAERLTRAVEWELHRAAPAVNGRMLDVDRGLTVA